MSIISKFFGLFRKKEKVTFDYYRCDTFDGVKNLIKGVL